MRVRALYHVNVINDNNIYYNDVCVCAVCQMSILPIRFCSLIDTQLNIIYLPTIYIAILYTHIVTHNLQTLYLRHRYY